MWVWKVRCSSKVIPTYFISWELLSLTPLSLIIVLGIGVLLFRKKMNSVLVEFNDILFANSQWFNDFRSLLSFLVRFLFLGLDKSIMWSRLVSSAKFLVVECFMQVCRSFMYTRKSSGPSTEPWGTPCSIVLVSEKVPWIDTYCLRFERYVKHSKTIQNLV